MTSLEPGRESFQRLRSKRISTREALSPTLRQSYDENLSQLLFATLGASIHGTHYRFPIRSIIKLLNRGATASYLDPHELNGPNLGYLVDLLDEDTSPESNRIFTLLDHIIASPCDSWATNRRYVGNGGSSLPCFFVCAVVTGDLWYFSGPKQVQNMYFRYRSWSSLRKMIWAYQDDLIANRLQTRRKGFVSYLFSEFLMHVSSTERTAILGNDAHRLFDVVVSFFKARSSLLLSEVEPTTYFRPLGPFSVELQIQIDFHLFQMCNEYFTVEEVFNVFFRSKQSRRMTLKLLSYPEFRTWILCENAVRELCRRKERVIFEELYLRDAERLTAMIPFALGILESKIVHGCKQRLIGFLRDVLLKNVGNEDRATNCAGRTLVGGVVVM